MPTVQNVSCPIRNRKIVCPDLTVVKCSVCVCGRLGVSLPPVSATAKRGEEVYCELICVITVMLPLLNMQALSCAQLSWRL